MCDDDIHIDIHDANEDDTTVLTTKTNRVVGAWVRGHKAMRLLARARFVFVFAASIMQKIVAHSLLLVGQRTDINISF
jgi:hypothetical protein